MGLTASSELPHVWQRTLVIVAVFAALVVFALPVWLTLVWSTWRDSEIFAFPPKLLPGPDLLSNLRSLNAAADIWHALFNSVLIGVVSAGGAVVLCACAGYAFAKFRFRFQNVIFYMFLGAFAIPGQISAIPLFIVMARVGWINTYQAVILPAAVPALGLFFMRSTISQIVPTEMLEAARLDGAGELTIVWRMVLPTILPNAASLGILLFSLSWSNLFWPLVVLRTNSMATIPVALVGLIGTYNQPYGELMAGAALGTIVPMGLFVVLRRYFIRGVVFNATHANS
jgi:lactose/L-arabinose transport system permease protein